MGANQKQRGRPLDWNGSGGKCWLGDLNHNGEDAIEALQGWRMSSVEESSKTEDQHDPAWNEGFCTLFQRHSSTVQKPANPAAAISRLASATSSACELSLRHD